MTRTCFRLRSHALRAVLLPGLLASLLLASAPCAQADEDALVQRLADIGAKWVQLTQKRENEGLTDAERAQRMNIEERVVAIATELLGEDARKVENSVIDELLLDALNLHRPAAAEIFRARFTAAPGKELESKLNSLYAALTISSLEDGTYPAQSEGLAALLAAGMLPPTDLLDPWGNPFRYEVFDEGFEFRVTSIGPDGLAGTPDDVSIDTAGELGGTLPDPYTDAPPSPEGLGSIPPSSEIWALALTADGRGMAYVAERDDGFHVGWGHGERGPFDEAALFDCGSVAGAVVFFARNGESFFLVTPEETRPADSVTGAAFVSGSTDLVVVEEIEGRTRVEVAGRPMALDGVPKPGQASRMLLDSSGRMCAWREQLADGRWVVHTPSITSEPVLWASDPVLLPLASGDVVSFRLWTGDATILVIGDESWRTAWARDPVVSPDGERVLVPVCTDGTPVADFAEARELQTRERLDWGYVRTPAFVSSTFSLLDGGELVGAACHGIGDPVFTPDGASWAYRVRDADGKWSVHRRMPEGLHAGPTFDEVRRPRWDATGTRVLHASRRGEAELLTCNALYTEAPWNVRVVSSEAGHAWITSEEDGARVTVASPDLSEVTAFKRYDEIDHLRWGPDGFGPVARVREGDQRRVWAADVQGETYPYLFPPVVAAGGRVGYVAQLDEGGYAAVVYLADGKSARSLTGEDTTSAFNAVGTPAVGPGGTIAFEVTPDGYGFSLLDDEPPAPSGGPARVVFFDADDWRKGPEVDDAAYLRIGAGDRISYVAEVNEQFELHMLEGPVLSRSEPYALIEDVELRPDGLPLAFVADDAGERRILIGTTPGPGGVAFRNLAPSPDGATLAYRMLHDDGRQRVHLDTTTVHLDAEPYGPFLWSPDSRYLMFRATHGEVIGDAVALRGRDLVVIVDREDPTSPRLVEADDLSFPRLTADGAGVELLAVRDGEPTHLVLPLDGD